MNKDRRKAIRKIIEQLEGLMEDLDMVKTEEEEFFDNLPDGFQVSKSGLAMVEGIDVMDDAYVDLKRIIYKLEEMLEG